MKQEIVSFFSYQLAFKKNNNLITVIWKETDVIEYVPGPYGKGYPRGKKTAAGRPPYGRATPQTAERSFGEWPAHRVGSGRVGHGRPGETLGSPWIPLLVRAWYVPKLKVSSKHETFVWNVNESALIQFALFCWTDSIIWRPPCRLGYQTLHRGPSMTTEPQHHWMYTSPDLTNK
jgi:hypothetical protein